MASTMCGKTATWEGAAWVSTGSSPARSGRWWEHSRSNALNVGLPLGTPAASRRGKASTTHTRPAESVRTLKPWHWPTPPHADQSSPVHAHNAQETRAFISLHLHAAPQHVDPRPPWWMRSQAILASLVGDLCRILQT